MMKNDDVLLAEDSMKNQSDLKRRKRRILRMSNASYILIVP
jgi:hypothetical protein